VIINYCSCLQIKQHLQKNREYKQDYQISAATFYLLKNTKNSVLDSAVTFFLLKANKQSVKDYALSKVC